MIKTARQLKDLIRNLSKDKSADAQILMRNYMMERFLERISLSGYRDKFILKGGMLVAAMVGLDARSTMDIDATVKGCDGRHRRSRKHDCLHHLRAGGRWRGVPCEAHFRDHGRGRVSGHPRQHGNGV